MSKDKLRDDLEEFYSANYPKGKMTKEEATKCLRRFNYQTERCFGYIPDFLSDEYKDKKETESIVLTKSNAMREWAINNNKEFDSTRIFKNNFYNYGINNLLELISGEFKPFIGLGPSYYEFEDYTKEMNFKYLLVYELTDFYLDKLGRFEKKHKKLMTLCALKDIEIIAVREGQDEI